MSTRANCFDQTVDGFFRVQVCPLVLGHAFEMRSIRFQVGKQGNAKTFHVLFLALLLEAMGEVIDPMDWDSFYDRQ
ncbi:MAG: hypothetical protein P8Z00_17820 [Anaerolineales bacterium]